MPRPRETIMVSSLGRPKSFEHRRHTSKNLGGLRAGPQVGSLSSEQVVLRAEQTGPPVVIWREGRIAHLSATGVRIEWEKKKETGRL